jgi:hypothetical protein
LQSPEQRYETYLKERAAAEDKVSSVEWAVRWRDIRVDRATSVGGAEVVQAAKDEYWPRYRLSADEGPQGA